VLELMCDPALQIPVYRKNMQCYVQDMNVTDRPEGGQLDKSRLDG
jgi:hypothetical protein